MIIGILKEIKIAENRVCMTPAGVEVMKHHKHQVLGETNAGKGSGFADAEYVQAVAEAFGLNFTPITALLEA